MGLLLLLCLFILIHQHRKLKVHNSLNEEIIKENEKQQKEFEKLHTNIEILNKEIDSITTHRDKLKQDADVLAKYFYEQSMETASLELEQSMERAGKNYQEAAQGFEQAYLETMKDAAQDLQQFLSNAKQELKNVERDIYDMKNTRAAMIEARLREKRINEQLDFYCLHIDPLEQDDILLLEKVKEKLNKPRILSMLIWQTFYQKQMTTLSTNILGAQPVAGVYKITNIETGECYVGQAVNVAARWRDHAKCGLGIDTPAGNKLYKAMRKYGLHKFSWELLEECSAAQLNEKEKHYIELYQSKDFGYNTTKGNN